MSLSVRLRQLALGAMAVLIPASTGGSALAAVNAPTVVHRGQASTLSQADIERLSANATQRSIVIFKNQHPEAPARIAAGRRSQAVDVDQAPVRNELSQLSTRDVKSFHLVNALAATISQTEIENLSANPAVQAVVPDAFRRFNPQNPGGARGSAGAAGAVTGATTLQQICPPDPGVPLLEPEALQVMNVEFQPGTNQPAAHDLADGTGVKVGIIADGLDPNNPDLQRNGQSIVFDYQDFSGFGNDAPTSGHESFLDAGAIASQGTQVYDLSGFVNPAHPLPAHCNIRIKGVAPGATLAVMNLAGPNAGFFNSTVIQGIQRAVDDDVDVLNESIGGNPTPDTRDDPVQLANVAAVAAGIVVVAGTGDAGPSNNIQSPGTGSGVIAAAGTTTYRVYRQITADGTQLSAGGWVSNNISALTSAGVSEFGARMPDVAAPGDRGWALCSTDTAHYFGCTDVDLGTQPPGIWAAGGTSLSCPLISGTAALVIQAYAKTHNGSRPTPDLVKRIIVGTAEDLGAPADHQGAGLVNSLKAVQLAMSVHDGNGDGTPTGNGLLVSRPNLTFIGLAGALHSFSIQVTNAGTSARELDPSLVRLSEQSVSADTGTVALSGSSPTFIDGQGSTDSYVLHQFKVSSKADYLNGDVVWNAQGSHATAVFETLFDPFGRVAAYSLLGPNASGRAHVEVRQPTVGTWTAVIFTVQNGLVYSGDVQFSFATQRFESAGSVSPDKRTLQPGQTVSLDVTVNDVNQPGDHVSSLRLDTGGSDDGSIPVVVRTLVTVNDLGGSFDGTLTGGGATGPGGQRETYQFEIQPETPSLNVAVQLRDVNYHLDGFLTDPMGMPRDVQSTTLIGPGGSDDGIGRTMQFFHMTPAAGLWTLTLLSPSPIDGAHLSEPFSATIDFKPASIVAHGLPSLPGSTLAAGQSVTATVHVVNTGNSNKDFLADARLGGKTVLPLLGSDVDNVPLPLSLFAQPLWFVPTHSDLLVVKAQGSMPILLEVTAANGDPDRMGANQPGNVSVAAVTAPAEMFPGFYFGIPAPAGPSPDGGISSGQTVDLVALVETAPFDSAVTSTTGDVWLQAVDANPAPYNPLTLLPGRDGTITLTITPNAPSGTMVRGVIAIDAFNLESGSADELALLPYSYRVR